MLWHMRFSIQYNPIPPNEQAKVINAFVRYKVQLNDIFKKTSKYHDRSNALKEHKVKSIKNMLNFQSETDKIGLILQKNVLPIEDPIEAMHIKKVLGGSVYNHIKHFLEQANESKEYFDGINDADLVDNFKTGEQVNFLKTAIEDTGMFNLAIQEKILDALNLYDEQLAQRNKLSGMIAHAKDIKKSAEALSTTQELKGDYLAQAKNILSDKDINATEYLLGKKLSLQVQKAGIEAKHDLFTSAWYAIYKVKDFFFKTEDANRYDIELIKSEGREAQETMYANGGGVEAFDKQFNADRSLLLTESLVDCYIQSFYSFMKDTSTVAEHSFETVMKNCNVAYDNDYIINEVKEKTLTMIGAYVDNKSNELNINFTDLNIKIPENAVIFMGDVLHQSPSPVHTAEV
ncbi:hypothetical protein RFI_25801 [Reticulomyxa filosa]|uniref:Uncharacterized protein n=1 Tax=Reticulomyxa filosa TaxID=46433 RepID=X6MDS2_RETFI|nr:hypothetical protein RFI_25801 [Reticulomyxa filosa]|eukprot:ETO11572.1 hypothetical protein RFI_25801 [Reticulomyxa filosa]